MSQDFIKIIKKKYPKFSYGKIKNITMITVKESAKIVQFLDYLKKTHALRFTILTDLFGADFPDKNERFEIVYNLLSLELNQRLIVKIHVNDGEQVLSLDKIHPSALWYQREVVDMYGIEFKNSPDNRRILTDYGFVGHPLRKDFPLSGHLQVKYDEKLEKVIYEKVTLDQDYRNFDFVSPWQGPGKVLPGDEKATK
jgi:NADH-quinone oxidoreductase subunit C